MLETPPRTWRRRLSTATDITHDGNTSTDVEKTLRRRRTIIRAWKHLHGRGEDSNAPQSYGKRSETPPRTWRRQKLLKERGAYYGNTSTDVEKTFRVASCTDRPQKHLHGRGEDFRTFTRLLQTRETPPRTWRRPPGYRRKGGVRGNTSTDVEKTIAGCRLTRRIRKHLHGRGEDLRPMPSQ